MDIVDDQWGLGGKYSPDFEGSPLSRREHRKGDRGRMRRGKPQPWPHSAKQKTPPVLEPSHTPSDCLYDGLPCVWDGSRHVIFSPYALKVARVKPGMLDLERTRRYLEAEGFFGSPLEPCPSPTTADIGLILTTECNLRCRYCYVTRKTGLRTMTPEFAIRVIRGKVIPGVQKISVLFFGGEPTLNMPAIKSVVEYIKRLGLEYRFIINTNGTACDRDLDFMISNGFIFSVSSDGPPETTDLMRPALDRRGSGRRVERTIRRVIDSRLLLQVRATITKENVTSLPDGIDYWSDLGVEFAHVEPASRSYGSEADTLRPDPMEYISSVQQAVDEAQRRGIWVISSPYMNLLTPSTYFCGTVAGERELYTPDGAISACYRVQDSNPSLSSFLIGRYQACNDTFSRDETRIGQLRSIIPRPQGPCATCHARYICAGGCPVSNQAETGCVLGVDAWACAVKKALVKDAVLRIARGSESGQVPAVLGQSIFEHLAAKAYRR